MRRNFPVRTSWQGDELSAMADRRIAERTEPFTKVSEKRRRLWQRSAITFMPEAAGSQARPLAASSASSATKDRRCRLNWRRRPQSASRRNDNAH